MHFLAPHVGSYCHIRSLSLANVVVSRPSAGTKEIIGADKPLIQVASNRSQSPHFSKLANPGQSNRSNESQYTSNGHIYCNTVKITRAANSVYASNHGKQHERM